MKFYNREHELTKLRAIAAASHKNAQFTVLTGRRRIGKTKLLLSAFKDVSSLYFFVAKKSEILLCQDFVKEITEKIKLPVLGEVSSFAVLFEYIVQVSHQQNITLIIDEFQEFYSVNPAVYSEMQRIWDLKSEDSKLNLIVSGSVTSLMYRIFESQKEPLFGRAQHFIRLQAFDTETMKQIIRDHNPEFTPDDLLALYSFTGGVAKYVELLMDNNAVTKNTMIQHMITKDSIFLYEGKNMLIEEFGRDHSIYFSILTSMAEGRNSRAEIEALLKKEVSGYLTRLENDFHLIKRSIPVLGKGTKHMKYFLEDNFLIFWFRFIYKYNYMIEIGAFDALQNIIFRDYSTFSGLMLERYFRLQAVESGLFTQIGQFWDRKGEIEIDLVAMNEQDKKMIIAEIKRKSSKISIEKLRLKTSHLEKLHPFISEYKKSYSALCLENM